MASNHTGLGGPYLAPGTSFFDFVRAAHTAGLAPSTNWPAWLGGGRNIGGGVHGDSAWPAPPVATTIVALTYPGGLVMAGDRRATMGTQIASRDIEKVYPADAASAIGVAGSAGIALQLVKLFQLELEHYEKIEGDPLSLDGKANRLATLLQAGLPMALQGLAALPIFGGFESGSGRLFSYDVTGGCYEEHDFHAIGSGAVFARGSLKKLWRDDLDPSGAAAVALAALVDAADDDAATGGIDRDRSIWPVVARVDATGYHRVDDAELAKNLSRATRPSPSSGASRARGSNRTEKPPSPTKAKTAKNRKAGQS